jgi:acyl-[acyl-carrier-protein] desaturase
MTANRSVSSENLLHELLPTVERSLDRHVNAATEWFPHEFVPYEEGRNFIAEPWQPADSHLPDVAQMALEVNLLTEDNLPYYHLAIWDTFGKDGAWGEWTRRWTAEEGRHAIVLRDYLTVTRGLDPVALERGRMDQVSRGYYPNGSDSFGSPLDGIAYTTIQELATRISHRNTGAFTGDPLIRRLCTRIAVDENLHYVFYRELGKAALEVDPSAMIQAIRRQVVGFTMPGTELPEFRGKAITMAKAGIYDLRIHHDQVLLPVLFKHWKLDCITGLDEEAERAREEIHTFLATLDALARKYEEKRRPLAAAADR